MRNVWGVHVHAKTEIKLYHAHAFVDVAVDVLQVKFWIMRLVLILMIALVIVSLLPVSLKIFMVDFSKLFKQYSSSVKCFIGNYLG